MKIAFCGGAEEVGASCYLINMDGKNILLDSGIRMKSGKDALPDFRRIQEHGGVDAIIVSHAHLDHTGSLPVISREYPGANIYMTHATKDLIRVLLYDSLKIMHRNEAEIPIYAENHVRSMLDRIVCYSPQFSFNPLSGSDIKVTFYNAGHVAGAVLIYIQGNEGTILYTGDISGVDQQTVNGASVPKLRPDVIMIESTYGDKLHSNRQVEEKKLVESVGEVVSRKGKILIPAFALGRAQEIILLLKKAINKGELPKIKIYVDGMVKDINRMYKLNPNYLKRHLAKKIFRGNDIFYDDNVIPVDSDEMRQEIVNSADGLCVIASSGMLKGGPSSFYAEKFAANPDNFIAITGYQDEESPGREILNLLNSEEEKKFLKINDRNIPLVCGIGKYGLSAHGDKGELVGIINRVAPRKIFLVHGEKEIIQGMAKELNKEVRAQIYVPINGEEYDIRFKNPRKQLNIEKETPPLNKKEELTEENIPELWEHIYKTTGIEAGYSIEELIYIWSGNNDFTNERINKYRDLLNKSKYFTPNSRRLFLYHPVKEEELAVDDNQVMEMNEMLNFVDEIFPKEARLYKKGARYDEKVAVLYFDFPNKAKKVYKEQIKKLEEKSGWKVEINADCNQGAAEELIYSLLPVGTGIDKLSYYRDKGYFAVTLDRKIDDMEKLQDKFEDITGLKLQIGSGNKEELNGVSLKPVDTEKMMEQNKAFAVIDKSFKDEKHKIFKMSKKVAGNLPYIELSFISPQVGERYKDLIKNLEIETGWNITIAQNPNQNEIIKVVKGLCKEMGIELKKNPSIYTNEGVVAIKIKEDFDPGIEVDIVKRFQEETGYKLKINA
ncbi:MAG: uncharacterized protein PWQ96_1364 [Clostridia bacterium]|nr:fold metallo-hydrolase [Clostridiales bacterium]MDK2985722.1 uncharacterized protein [Clostridia bacterium]